MIPTTEFPCDPSSAAVNIVRSEKLQNESFPNFRISHPNLSPNLVRILPEIFQDFSCFVSCETETRKIHQKSPPFSMPIPQAKWKKSSQKFSGEWAS